MHNYVGLHHIYYPFIQNRYLTFQTGCMSTSFSVWWNKFLSMTDRIVLSLELTYNGARDLYASMEQQMQPLNLKSKLSPLPSLDNPVY